MKEEHEYSIKDAITKLHQLIQLNMCPKLFREIIGYLEELQEYKENDADCGIGNQRTTQMI